MKERSGRPAFMSTTVNWSGWHRRHLSGAAPWSTRGPRGADHRLRLTLAAWVVRMVAREGGDGVSVWFSTPTGIATTEAGAAWQGQSGRRRAGFCSSPLAPGSPRDHWFELGTAHFFRSIMLCIVAGARSVRGGVESATRWRDDSQPCWRSCALDPTCLPPSRRA
jgi:hypothetical protein